MSTDRELQDSLWTAASQLSPRRQQDGGTATTSLPFYENIAPGEALKRLFAWFHPKPLSNARDKDGMSLDEFNQLRRCVGHPVVTSAEWTAAMRELHPDDATDVWVRESEFNELFGFAPFFGIHESAHTPVHLSIMRQVAATEQFVHFLLMLFEKFANPATSRLTYAAVQVMQRKACVKTKIDERSWERLCHQVQAVRSELQWHQFGQAWHVNLNTNGAVAGHFLFGSNGKPLAPADVVQTILAEEKLATHFAKDNLISRQALHGLLKVGTTQRNLADKEWCSILEENQTAYPGPGGGAGPSMRVTEASRGAPHDIIVHNANNMMMYEIAFDEPGALGIQVQSDFFGQCMSVHAIDGQAKKHPTIQKDDIVASIDGQLVFFDPIDSVDGERTRQNTVQTQLDTHDTTVRKVVFLRQEVYYHIQDTDLKLSFRTYEPIGRGGVFSVQLPPGATATGDAVTVSFEQTLQDLLRPTCKFDPATSTVTVTLTGAKGIKQEAFMTMFIHGIATRLLAGPGVVLHTPTSTDNEENTIGTTITLFKDWSTWRALVQENFIAPKAPRPSTKFADPSLRPITVEVVRGDPGITFAADFFGQCAVVAELDPLKDVEGVAKDDVLSAIVFQNSQGVPERFNAIKPFALSGSTDNHYKTVMAALADRAKSEEPFTLHFLRLQSHYMQMGDRTTLTFNALTDLGPNSTIVVEMPTADWKAKDAEGIEVEFLKPTTVRASKTYWNAASHVFEITLDASNDVIPENSQVILALTGIQGVADKSAGPSEITVASAGRMRFELHDHWHSFLGGLGGVAADNLVDVLTRLKTSPLDLWTILEYAHLLFRMFQDDKSQFLTYDNAMLFREAVTGDATAMDVEKWTKFCRSVDAKPRLGLTEKQFTCSVLELLNLDRRFLSAKFEGHDLKRLYVHLHSVDKLFDEALELFEDGHHHTTVHIDSLRGLHKACFPSVSWDDFLQQMQRNDVAKYEWTQNDFYRIFALANKKLNPVDAWVKLHYSKLLFDEFARVRVIRKQELRDLLAARKSSFELDDDVWVKLCANIEGDHGSASSGIKCAGFVQLYPSAAFGNRDSVLDWNYIQAYKMEPEPRHTRAAALAAEIQAAPEKISVNALAEDVLNAVASTDDFAEEAVNAGIAFSRTEEVVERLIELKDPAWSTAFESNLATRDKGVLQLTVQCASELRDAAESDASSTALEQYYIVAYTITRDDWTEEFKKSKGKPWRKKARDVLFGQRPMSYKCAPHEEWDQGQSQELVASYEAMEHQFEHYPRDNPDDYKASRDQMAEVYHTMNPYAVVTEDAPLDLRSHRMISRLVNKDPLVEGVVKFPDERFRLYLDRTRTSDEQTHVVLKLLKRTERARKFNPQKYERLVQATIELGRAEKSERVIRALLEKQKQLLVESLHLFDVTAELEMQMTKFKRKEHEADALQQRIAELRNEVASLEAEQAAWRQNQKRAKFKTQLLGQTALPLQDFLDVLHDDSLETDDVALIYDDEHKASGKLLLSVQYKCDTVSKTADAQPLVAIDSDKLEFPADAPLAVKWATSDEFGVQQGDSICLVRENDDKKLMLNTAYFTLFWSPKTGNWDIFDSSVALYSNGETKVDILHRTPPQEGDGAKASGWFLLPSARDLSLPPGTYRLSLIRKETIDGVNYRSSVGASAGLNVYVGVNSIHTVFGTTPLVDVKTVKCSLSIVDTTTNLTQVSTMPVSSSSWWFRARGYDAELDNSIAMWQSDCARLEHQLTVRDLRAAKRKRVEDQLALCRAKVRAAEEAKTNGVAGIRTEQTKIQAELDGLRTEWQTLKDRAATAADPMPLEQQQRQIEQRCRDLEDQVKGWALVRVEFEKRRSVLQLVGAQSAVAPPEFNYKSTMRVDFFLEGASGTLPQNNPHLNDLTNDCVLVLPQVVVETSDRIRVKILGKLQTSDAEKTNRIRKQIQWELHIMLTVVQFANANIFEKARTYVRLWRALKKLRNVRWLYVFEECLPIYRKASNKLKTHFPAIIAELIEELQCRTDELELESEGQVKNNLFRRQIPVKEYGYAHEDRCGATGSIQGSVASFVGDDVSDGDMYICKYMRRGHNSGSLGELGRVGPFAIQSSAKKSSWFNLTVHQKLALAEAGFHLFVLTLKYFVALLNLSFNVSFVSSLAMKIEWPNLNFEAMRALQEQCLAALRGVVPVVREIFAWFDEFFANLLQYIMVDLNIFKYFTNCTHGIGMLVNWVALWATALFLYIVIQEDILAKVQKIGSYLPIELGKAGEDRFEQLGSILVSPVLIVIKVLILFIAQQWTVFSGELWDGDAFAQPLASQQCNVAGLDHALQVTAAVLLITFFYFFFPLLVLDMFSWVPPFDLKSDEDRVEASHHGRKQGIHDSVDNNVNLIDYGDNAKDPKWSRWCSLRNLFWFHGTGQRVFMDYKYSSFHKLTKTYGFVGIWFVILYVYTILLLQSIVRAMGAVFGWRGKRGYMYPRAHLRGASSWTDKFCCRFNAEWKRYWVFKKVLKPLLDVFAVTFGLWNHDRWDVYDIEERGKSCFPMEPNNEIKQLQMMSLHGKVNSLLWLPFSSAGVLTFISDCMNRGPILSYFFNDQFLQADRPESERVKKVKLRLMRWGKARDDDQDEAGVVYLVDTEFFGTLTKWASSMVELASVLTLVLMPLINQHADGLGTPATAALIAAFVAPVMEFNHQLLKTYKKFQEFATVEQAKLQESLQGAIDAAQGAASTNAGKLTALQDGGLGQVQTVLSLNNEQASVLGKVASIANDKATDVVTGKISDAENSVSDKLGAVGIDVTFAPVGDSAGGQDDDDETESEADADDDGTDSEDEENDKGEDTKGDLVVLTALPEASYIIQSDKLDVGEGEITVNWRVNSKRRFHASDAIGMFPARSLDNLLTRRTIDQCVCYRLVSETDPEPFGWKPDSANENHHDKVLMKRAVALEKILHRKIGSLHRQAVSLARANDDAANDTQDKTNKPEDDAAVDESGERNTELVDFSHAENMFDHVLAHSPPSPKKMHDILLEEIEEHKDEFDGHAVAEALKDDRDNNEETALSARSSKTVNGHVKFRPCNSNEAEDHPKREDFVFGNAAGIYPCKYGMEKYEFLYLRYVGNKLNEEREHSSRASYVIVDNQESAPLLDDDDRDGSPSTTLVTTPDDFDPLNKFSSNSVGVGTFDLFIRLSSDSPLMWANQAVNVSWNIYGVAYSVLSHPNNRNCIAFYKVKDIHNTRKCSKLEIVPPSAFFPNHGSGPVTGRMMVTTPTEPGMYEIRFLFNYFHAAKLHRRCQVFGLLEENMQAERISNLFVKRDMAQSLGLLHHQEQHVWNTAILQAYAWYLPILNNLLVVASTTPPEILEHPAKFAKSMVEEFSESCYRLVCQPNPQLQSCLERMLQPLWTPGFMAFLHGTFSQSRDMVAHAKSFTFVSPTDPYKDTFVSHQLDMLRAASAPRASTADGTDEPNVSLTMIRLLHDDADLIRYGPTAFEQMALDYLDARSYLPGHMDLLDDLILNHSPLLNATSLILDNVAITCCALFEPAVNNAVQGFFRLAKEDKKTGLFQEMDVHLKDGCRSHLAKLIRAAFATDVRTGQRYGGWRLDEGERVVRHCTMNGASVLMHRALRTWVKPRLVKYIMKTLSRRYASLTSSNVAVAKKMARSVTCRRPPEFRRSPVEALDRQPKTGQSVVFFLDQAQHKDLLY